MAVILIIIDMKYIQIFHSFVFHSFINGEGGKLNDEIFTKSAVFFFFDVFP